MILWAGDECKDKDREALLVAIDAIGELKRLKQKKLRMEKELEETAEAMCERYCRWPYIWDEEKEGKTLSDSDKCRLCPLNKMAEQAAEQEG